MSSFFFPGCVEFYNILTPARIVPPEENRCGTCSHKHGIRIMKEWESLRLMQPLVHALPISSYLCFGKILWIISVAQPRKRSPWFHDRVASSAVSYPVDVSIFVVYIPDHKLAHRLLQAYATVQTHQDSLYIFRNYGRVRWRFVARIFVICGHGNTRDNRHDRTGITLAFLISCLVYCKCTRSSA
jgi:hypothetical protein